MKYQIYIFIAVIILSGVGCLPTDSTVETDSDSTSEVEQAAEVPTQSTEDSSTSISQDHDVKLMMFKYRHRLHSDILIWHIEYDGKDAATLFIDAYGAVMPGTVTPVAEIHLHNSPSGTDPQILGTKIYFVNNGKVYVLDLETGGLGEIEITVASEIRLREYLLEHPEIDPNTPEGINVPNEQENIFGIFVTEDEIVYLARDCGEGGYCYLGIYDRKTGGSTLISDDVYSRKERAQFTGFWIDNYDPQTKEVTILRSGGDGPDSSSLVYRTIFDGLYWHDDEGTPMQFIDSYTEVAGVCVDEGGNELTTDECERDFEKFQSFLTDPVVKCGKYDFVDSIEGVIATSDLGRQTLLSDSQVLGCYE